MERAREVLEHFGAVPATGPSVQLSMRFDRGRPPDPEGPVTARHLDLVVTRDDHGVWISGGGSVGWIAVDGRLGRIWTDPGALVPLRMLTAVLFHQLRARGGTALHAACVADGDAGVLIVAPSGSGKSTLSLALARLGWSLVSDDSVLLAEHRGHVHALALRRGLHLRPSDHPTERFRPCPLLEGTKEQLLAELPSSAACDPVLVVLPELSGLETTTFAPVQPAELCWTLCAESRIGELDHGGAADQLALLARLIGQVRAVRARLGEDVLRRPAAVSDALRELLRGAGAARPTPERPDGLGPHRAERRGATAYARLPDGSAVVLHPEDLEPIALDPQGAAMWEALEHGTGAAVARLAAESGAAPEEVEEAVRGFVEELRAHGLRGETW